MIAFILNMLGKGSWNNRCEYQKDIVSCAYTLNITANAISVASTSDEDFVICDYKGTNMYEIIMSTFDAEVETNLEREVNRNQLKYQFCVSREQRLVLYDIA